MKNRLNHMDRCRPIHGRLLIDSFVSRAVYIWSLSASAARCMGGPTFQGCSVADDVKTALIKYTNSNCCDEKHDHCPTAVIFNCIARRLFVYKEKTAGIFRERSLVTLEQRALAAQSR